MILSPSSNVELTKISYYDRRISTISREKYEEPIKTATIIKKNVFGHKWVLKINENETGTKNKSKWKVILYVLVTSCIIVAVCFGIFFSLEKTIFKKTYYENVSSKTFNKTNEVASNNTSRFKSNQNTNDRIQNGTKNVSITQIKLRLNSSICNCINNDEEICMKILENEKPKCVKIENKMDPTGCGGLCKVNTQYCKILDMSNRVYQCRDIKAILKCPNDTYNCGNRCIPLVEKCDGTFHCSDHSDENDCKCNLETHFTCGNSTSCLENKKRCDGKVDCWDKSDENNCHACKENEAPCHNGQCINKQLFCDGTYQCMDKSDEPDGCR